MADFKKFGELNVKDETARNSINEILDYIPSGTSATNFLTNIEHAPRRYANSGNVNIEDTLAADNEHLFFTHIFTASGTTGELVTLTNYHLFNIVNIPCIQDGDDNNYGVIQIAFGIASVRNTAPIAYRTKHWWGSSGEQFDWSNWRSITNDYEHPMIRRGIVPSAEGSNRQDFNLARATGYYRFNSPSGVGKPLNTPTGSGDTNDYGLVEVYNGQNGYYVQTAHFINSEEPNENTTYTRVGLHDNWFAWKKVTP